MHSGARTPEELEVLLEDAFVMRDRAGVGDLFHESAVLAAAGGPEARGRTAIGHAADDLWTGGRTYVAGLMRVLQARDIALVLATAGIHVARRSGDGTWRVAISLIDLPDPPTRQEHP